MIKYHCQCFLKLPPLYTHKNISAAFRAYSGYRYAVSTFVGDRLPIFTVSLSQMSLISNILAVGFTSLYDKMFCYDEKPLAVVVVRYCEHLLLSITLDASRIFSLCKLHHYVCEIVMTVKHRNFSLMFFLSIQNFETRTYLNSATNLIHVYSIFLTLMFPMLLLFLVLMINYFIKKAEKYE